MVFREYRDSDLDRICQIRELVDSESRERFFQRMKKSGEWDGHYLHFAIEVDGQLAGDLQLRHCDKTFPKGSWAIGIELATESRGKGIGTKVLNQAKEYCFTNGCHRLEGSTDISNLAMQRAFVKANWNFEGRLRALFIENGVAKDYMSYAVTKFD